MPFKSVSQMRACHAKSRAGTAGSWNCKEWARHTKSIKALPEKSGAHEELDDPTATAAVAGINLPWLGLLGGGLGGMATAPRGYGMQGTGRGGALGLGMGAGALAGGLSGALGSKALGADPNSVLQWLSTGGGAGLGALGGGKLMDYILGGSPWNRDAKERMRLREEALAKKMLTKEAIPLASAKSLITGAGTTIPGNMQDNDISLSPSEVPTKPMDLGALIKAIKPAAGLIGPAAGSAARLVGAAVHPITKTIGDVAGAGINAGTQVMADPKKFVEDIKTRTWENKPWYGKAMHMAGQVPWWGWGAGALGAYGLYNLLSGGSRRRRRRYYDEDDDKEASAKRADHEEAGNPYGISQIGMQRYLPVGGRRKLSPEEEKDVERGSSQWIGKLFPGYSTPLPDMMSSPGKGALMHGLGFGGLGALLGAVAGAKADSPYGGMDPSDLGSNKALLGALLGGSIGGIGGGLAGYFSRRQENENLDDIMRRLPPKATLRDYRSDPVVGQDTSLASLVANRGGMDSRSALLGALLAKEGKSKSKKEDKGIKSKRELPSWFKPTAAGTAGVLGGVTLSQLLRSERRGEPVVNMPNEGQLEGGHIGINVEASFKAGFLLRCMEEGLNPVQIADRSEKLEGLSKSAASGNVIKDLIMAAFHKPFNLFTGVTQAAVPKILEYGLGSAIAAPLALGLGGGYAAGKIRNMMAHEDPRIVQREALLDEYQNRADEAEEQQKAKEMARKHPQEIVQLA